MLLEVDLLDVNYSTTAASFSVLCSSPFLLLALCPPLSKGYAILNLHFHVRVELGPASQVSEAVLAKVNDLLEEVSEELRLKRV